MRVTYVVETSLFESEWDGLEELALARDEAREYVYGMGGTSFLHEYHDDKLVKTIKFESEGGDGEQETDEVVFETVVFKARK